MMKKLLFALVVLVFSVFMFSCSDEEISPNSDPSLETTGGGGDDDPDLPGA